MKDPWDSHSEEAEIYSLTSTFGWASTFSMNYMLQWSSLK